MPDEPFIKPDTGDGGQPSNIQPDIPPYKPLLTPPTPLPAPSYAQPPSLQDYIFNMINRHDMFVAWHSDHCTSICNTTAASMRAQDNAIKQIALTVELLNNRVKTFYRAWSIIGSIFVFLVTLLESGVLSGVFKLLAEHFSK